MYIRAALRCCCCCCCIKIWLYFIKLRRHLSLLSGLNLHLPAFHRFVQCTLKMNSICYRKATHKRIEVQPLTLNPSRSKLAMDVGCDRKGWPPLKPGLGLDSHTLPCMTISRSAWMCIAASKCNFCAL